jgi:hypothetical protein
MKLSWFDLPPSPHPSVELGALRPELREAVADAIVEHVV